MYVPAFFGLLLAALVSGQVDISPREAVRRVGQDVTVLCKVPFPIDSCRMTVGKATYRLGPNNHDANVNYAGAGYEQGECGAHIENIIDAWHGNVTCFLPPSPQSSVEITAFMRLIVAKRPTEMNLIANQPVEGQGQYTVEEGNRLEAQCVVSNGRPAARVTWFLGEEQLLTGVHQPIIEQVPGQDLETIRVNLTRVMSADDGGRRLICRAEHEDLDSPMESSAQIIVNYPPRRADGVDNQITIFGLKLGGEGRLNVTVRASPDPGAKWTISGAEMVAPSRNEDESIVALAPVALGGGYHNVTLLLRRVEKADVDRVYYLRVSNARGDADFSVRISTMDEPAGVELDAGAVVGIVIAALVLIIAVSLLVFAKATDRWCFAGGRDRDPAKSSGESSDTESAAGGRRRETRAARARAAALGAWGRVRAAMPKGRDKVQASEQTQEAEDDKPVEKKEGVVYAELALGETGAREAVLPPPSTEYAEIVYTDQGQKETKE